MVKCIHKMEPKVELKKEADKSFQLIITVPASLLKKYYQTALKQESAKVEIKGFRKGKAPAEVAEEKIGKEKLYQTALQKIISEAYEKTIKDNSLSPIISPKISILSAKEDKDWQVKVTSCELPEVDLGDFEEEIKKANAKEKIWIPGKEPSDKGEKTSQAREERIKNVVAAIVKSVKVTLPKVLIEAEVEKRLIELIDQLQSTGLTVNQYLSSKGVNLEQLKEQYKKEAETTWKIELTLEISADKHKIVVEKEEIEKIKKPNLDPYLAARIIRREKTLERLISL